MKTDELISLLAATPVPVSTHAVERRFAIALGLGLPLSVLLMLITMGLRADLAQAVAQWAFWMKLTFTAFLALGGLVVTERLSRPGVKVGFTWAVIAAPLLVVWLVSAISLLTASPEQRLGLVMGSSWRSCAFNIALLSVPLLILTFWCVKDLAPTRLTLTGASAGFLSGALSALVYALHCTESAAPFLGIWYVFGIATPTLIGASLGSRLLRW